MRKNCPICNKWNKSTIETSRKSNGSNIINFNLHTAICMDCKFKYQAPEIEAAKLASIYEDDYVGGEKEQIKRFSKNKIFRKTSALSFERYINNSTDFSILEIGCSSGYNIANISEKYSKVFVEGVDLDRESIEFGKNKGLNISNKNAFESNKRYDIVFLNHVFEHIVDLDGFISLLLKKVKKNGVLAINVPNSLKWREPGSWEHVNYFSEKAFKQLLLKNGISNFDIATHFVDKKRHYIPEIRVIITKGNLKVKTRPVWDIWTDKDSDYIYRSRARENLDVSSSKTECKKQIKTYKEHKKGRKLKELLIWSRLYRLFTGKWLKTK